MGQGKCYTSVITNKGYPCICSGCAVLIRPCVCEAPSPMWKSLSAVGALLCHSLKLVVAVCRCVCAVEVYMKKISEERWKERRKLLQGSWNVVLVLKNPERECTDVNLLIFFLLLRDFKSGWDVHVHSGRVRGGMWNGNKWMTGTGGGNRWHHRYSL